MVKGEKILNNGIRIIALLMVCFVMTSCTPVQSKDAIQAGQSDDQAVEETDYKLDCQNTHILNEELYIEKIVDGVFNVNHEFPWDANSLIIEMQTGEVVLIDTPYDNEATRLVVDWIRDQAGKDVTIVAINTGYHFDNLGGNQYLSSQNIETIGTSTTVEWIEKGGDSARQVFLDWLQGDDMKKYHDIYVDLEYVAPSKVIDIPIGEEYTIRFGSESLSLYYPGASHAPDNINVYYSNKKILFGGCMVKAEKADNLGNTKDANINDWTNSINNLMTMYPANIVDVVIPGHGDIGDFSCLERTKTLLSKQSTENE